MKWRGTRQFLKDGTEEFVGARDQHVYGVRRIGKDSDMPPAKPATHSSHMLLMLK